MPQILRVGPYSIYFWSNEGKLRIVETNSAEIISEWCDRFGDIRYFC